MTMANLDVSYDSLSSLPTLPEALGGAGSFLHIENNKLTNLPALPSTLEILYVMNNQLTSLPILPSSMVRLDCYSNQLTSLPPLPNSLSMLTANENQLTSVPNLPDSMQWIFLDNNPTLNCLPRLTKIASLTFFNTAITCIPDYGTVGQSIPPLNTKPLCSIFNPNGCSVYSNISGTVFYDANTNCVIDPGDAGLNYVKLQLFTGSILQQQTYTGGIGDYSFLAPGNSLYNIVIDTTTIPFKLNCPASGINTVALSALDSFSYNNQFSFKCLSPGYDIGVQSILNYGITRPASIVKVNTVAGDMTELYGAHCATGLSGQVQISFSGQATYLGPAPGAIPPTSVNGDTIIWNIADFGSINDQTAFNLMFGIDTFATPGSNVCIIATVTPNNGDYNLSNNILKFCFTIVDALDPNEKEVYPTHIDSTNQWLTYTIRFQNTGTAPAVNIHVNDTLDNNLDPSTFQLLTYSARNLTQIFGKTVIFNFPNINLPDSATSDSASRGYVQYKIKLKNGITPGTTVNNTASIYFDLNSPVVTNTVANIFSVPNCTTTFGGVTDTICQGDTVYIGPYPFTQTGTHNAILTNVGGCDSLVSLNLTVNPINHDTIFQTVCHGDTFYIGTHAHTQTGRYTDTLSNINGCDSIVTLNLQANGPLSIWLTYAPDSICVGDQMTFTANPANYVWYAFYINDSLIVQSTARTFSTSVIQPGDSVSVMAFDGTCYSPMASVYPKVHVIPPAPVLSVLPVSDTICGGDTAIFTAAPGYAGYVFYNGSSLQQSGTSNIWITNQLGANNQVNVAVVDHGCVSIRSNYISVYVKVTPLAIFNLAGNSFCTYDSAVTLTGLPAGGTFTGSGVSGNQFNPATANPGTDTLVYAYADSDGCNASARNIVHVVSFPDSISLGYYNDTVGVNTFYVQQAVTGNYTWQVISYQNGGAIINVSTDDSFTALCYYLADQPVYQGMGPLIVRAVVSLDNCADTTAWDTINLCQTWGYGISPINPNTHFTLYPNPADDYVMIDFDAAHTGSTIFVKDITGRELIQTKLSASPQQIPTGNLPPGVYLVTLYNNGEVGARLLVKE